MTLISNYAIKPTPELALRSNRTLLPARLIAALAVLRNQEARMGLSRCAIYIKNANELAGRDFLIRMGLLEDGAVSKGHVPEQSHIEDGDFGIAEEGSWTVVFSDSEPYLEGIDSAGFEKLSLGREVFFWLTQSTSGGMWFESWKDGKLQRKWIEVDGAVEENFGAELSQEPGGYFDSSTPEGGRDEWSVAELAGRISGVSVDRLFEMPFNVYSRGNG